MEDVIYLVMDQAGVRRMTKSPPDTKRGEMFTRLEITVAPSAFRPPVLTRKVVITDWREGMDLPDPQIRDGWITEEEAAVIRAKREQALVGMVRDLGYDVTARPAERTE